MDTRATIPSLCASTASCGAAAVGFSFGRSHSTYEVIRGGTDGEPFDRSTPINSPHTTSAPTSLLPKPKNSILRRPQSATFPRAVPSWGPLHEESPSLGQNSLRTPRPSGLLSDEAPTPHHDTSSPSISRSLWPRRASAIAQFQDGSIPSTPRPSTPSVFSNGSNAPFFPSNQPITPRNRLVKRSTSQRVLHSGSLSGSNFSVSQTPTFRRPATSHQRSQQLRIQNFQHSINYNAILQDTSHDQEQLEEFRDYFGAEIGGEDSTAVPVEDDPRDSWLPYFRSRPTYFAKDSSLRSPSVSRSIVRSDTINCIPVVPGQTPILLKAESITKLVPDEPQLRPAVLTSSPTASGLPSVSTNAGHKKTVSEQLPKSRHSFSIGDIMSSPSPTWKIRGGSIRRKRGRDSAAAGRRIVSAPQQGIRGNDGPESLSVEAERPIEWTLSAVNEDSNVGAVGQRNQQRTASSPLPPLQRLSAFDIDLLTTTSQDSPVAEPNVQSSPPTRDSPIYSSGLAGPSSRIRTHRISRIASDRDSTVFSSDNEQSRVFSTDGEDADYRSETVYDSIRTEATGSSHSGARGHRIETVFGDSNTTELAKHNLAALQDKLSGVPHSSQYGHDNVIAEEEESLRTPVRVTHDGEPDMPNPSPGGRLSQARDVSSSPPLIHPKKTSNRSRADDFDDSEADDDWSVNEDEDENWDDGVLGISAENAPTTHFALSKDNLSSASKGRSTELPLRPRSNVIDWTELQDGEGDPGSLSSARPKTARAKQLTERGSRNVSRWGSGALHVRSQSVPLPPENSNNRFNNASKLDAWILGGKGVSEDWDGDFEFDEPQGSTHSDASRTSDVPKSTGTPGVFVPPAILERQASVHGQFGQVKELTLLVEELRRLRHSAHTYGLLQGQSAELWREAEGIIDLATLDEDEDDFFHSYSPHSTSFEFDALEDDPSGTPRHRKSTASPKEDFRVDSETTASSPAPSSAAGSKFGTPTNRPRKESVAKAKHVLENIHQHRNFEQIPTNSKTSPKKLPFDTTSLRDLVTRAGVVTRALKEIIRRAENPDYIPQTPERRSETPPDPPFSQIFHQQPSPPSSKKSPRVVRRKSSNGFLASSTSNNDTDRSGHMQIMTVV